MLFSRIHIFSALLAAMLPACSTDPGLPVFQAELGETVRDEALLSKLCKRPIPTIDANSIRVTMQGKPAAQPGEISFPQFSSERSILGKEGTGRTEVLYVPRQGAPCAGEMTFSFRQDTSAEKVGKRGMKYTSEITLSDVVVTPK